jgi:hypothetical protein
MSMYFLPKTILKRMDRTRKRFFWKGGGEKKKYYLVKWNKTANSKQKGGLGIKNSRKMNLGLFCKWWWKLEHEEGLWQEIVRKKYKINRGITLLKRNVRNSPIWNDLLKVKQLYLKGRLISIGNGQSTSFWDDPWCGVIALEEKFKDLHEICTEQSKNVVEIAERGWRLNFRRWLDERAQNQWRQMRDMLATCALSPQKDLVKWTWEKTRNFSVKSMYDHLCSGDVNESNNKIWKSKIPLKIKIFMWLIQQDAILTKNNLAKRNWSGDKKCYFCHGEETVEHLFFGCPVARYIWSLIAFITNFPL